MNGITLLSAAALSAVVANAITVRFDDKNRGPVDQLKIRGVTVTKSEDDWGGRVGTVKGVGLGVEGGLSLGIIERNAYVPAGATLADEVVQPTNDRIGLIEFPGMLKSVTVMPHIDVSSEEPHIRSGFPLWWVWRGEGVDGTFTHFFLPPTHEITFEVDETWFLNEPDGKQYVTGIAEVGTDYNDVESFVYFYSLNSLNGSQETYYHMGYSITAIEYIPFPDAGSTSALLSIGFVGLIVIRRNAYRMVRR
jgi:hypothetical protein